MAYMYQNILCNVGERTKESSMSGTYSTASMSPPRIEGVFAPAYCRLSTKSSVTGHRRQRTELNQTLVTVTEGRELMSRRSQEKFMLYR